MIINNKIKEISADDDNPYSEKSPLRNPNYVDMLVSEEIIFKYFIIIDEPERLRLYFICKQYPNNFVIEYSLALLFPDAPTSGYIDRGLGNYHQI